MDETIDSGASLVKQWGALSDAAIIGAVILGIAIVIAVIIYIVFKYKITKSIQDYKNNRLKEYDKMYNGMQRSISDMSKAVKGLEEEYFKINNHLSNQKEKINKLESEVKSANNMSKEVLQKTSGFIGREDSAAIIKLYFLNVAYYEIERIVHNSLRKNDYSVRAKWILDRVKSEIGEVLSQSRSALNDLNLSISISKFFKIDSGRTKERFMLVNIIWGGIEEFYTSNRTLDQKLEESSLKIKNMIKDYLDEVFVQQEQTGFFKR